MLNAKLVVYGFLAALLLNVLITCSKDSSNPAEPNENPNDNPIVQEIEQDTKVITDAFKSGDVAQVRAQLTEGALEKYGADLATAQQKFVEFGNALANKTLIAYSEIYAEYEVEINGIKYVVAFTKQSDDSDWKLVRM